MKNHISLILHITQQVKNANRKRIRGVHELCIDWNLDPSRV